MNTIRTTPIRVCILYFNTRLLENLIRCKSGNYTNECGCSSSCVIGREDADHCNYLPVKAKRDLPEYYLT